MSAHRKRANALVAKLQTELKGPHDQERALLSAQLKELVRKAEEEQGAIRARLKELNNIIAPMDALIVDVSQAGKLSNADTANKLLDELEARQ